MRKPDNAIIARVDTQDHGRLVVDGAFVVGDSCAIGRADLAEFGAAGAEDVGKAKAAADFDQLPARYQNLFAIGEGLKDQQCGCGVVVHDKSRLSRRQRNQQVVHVLRSFPATPRGQIVFQVEISAGCFCDGLNRRFP